MGETVSSVIAGILTLCVLSRIFGDNAVFRATQYLFVGVSLGYGFVVLYHQVLVPAGRTSLTGLMQGDIGTAFLAAVPFLGLLLLLPRILGPAGLSWVANFPLGIIFGIGVALSLIGALVGTLVPQILATTAPVGGSVFDLVGSVLLLVGVIITLSYFFFTLQQQTPAGRLLLRGAQAGRWLLMVTFGFFLAGALVTYLTALNERLNSLVGLVRTFLPF